jgi:hypothetical protein
MSSHEHHEQRKEQQFFQDAAIDRMMGSVMALAKEVFVLRSRLHALESQLTATGALDADEMAATAGDEEAAAIKASAKAFAAAILKPLLGLQDAVGPTDPDATPKISEEPEAE